MSIAYDVKPQQFVLARQVGPGMVVANPLKKQPVAWVSLIARGLGLMICLAAFVGMLLPYLPF